MTSIHEPEAGSLRSAADPGARLLHAESQAAALARRNDELELIIAASRLGFCLLQGETGELRANSQFKADWGWPPDALLDWESLRKQVASETRAAFSDALRAAFCNGADFELLVQIQPLNATPQWLALHGRTSNDGTNRRTLILI